MERLSQYITDFISKRREANKQKKREELRMVSLRTVQVKEFNGGLYLCHNGIPLVNLNYLSNVQEVLNDARTISNEYIEFNNISFNAR